MMKPSNQGFMRSLAVLIGATVVLAFGVLSQTHSRTDSGTTPSISRTVVPQTAIHESDQPDREFEGNAARTAGELPLEVTSIPGLFSTEARRSLDAVGGPDSTFYYSVDNLGDTTSFNWIELCGDPLAADGPTGDNGVSAINLGFSFGFYGGYYSTAYVSTNGLITLGAPDSSGANVCMGSDFAPATPVIGAYWDDQLAADSGGCNNDASGPWVRYRSFGNYVVIQWQSLRQADGDSERYSYEALLFDDGTLKLQYNFTAPANPSASIGIDAPGIGNGLSYACDTTNGGSVAAGRAVWFYRLPANAADLTVQGLSPCGTVAPNPAQPVAVRVRNAGSSVSAPTVARFTFDNGVTTDSVPVSPLAPGDSADIVFAQTVNLSVGVHSLRAFVDHEAGTPRPNDTTSCTITVIRPCASCEPSDIDLGDISTVVWDGIVSGNCGNGGKWVGRFTGIAGATYHWDLCENPPAGGTANFDVDIKITNAACGTLVGSNGSCPGFGFYLSYRPNDFTWHCIATGTYYVVLAPYPSYTGHICTGTAANTFTMRYYRTEAVPPPPNDDCANAEVITVNAPASTCATTLGATIDCNQHSAFGELWYRFTITQCSDVAIEYCSTPAFGGLLLSVLYADSCCGTQISFSSVSYTRCIDGRPTIVFTQVYPGTYWLPVGLSIQGPFCIRVVAEPCFECQCQSEPNTFCNILGGPIDDFDTLLVPIVVTTAYRITDANVCVDLVHPYLSDLDLYLISPSGTRVELATDVGGSGDNFACTTFDDSAAILISAGSPPYSGSFRPEGSLGSLHSENAAGRWYLEVYDDALGITGLVNWTCLTFEYSEIIVPDTVWVDDDWSALSYGDTASGHVFGFNAFGSVAAALAAVGDSGVVLVAAGTYRESDLDILHAGLTLAGAGEEVTFIGPSLSDGHVCDDTTSAHHGIVIAASGVTIRDLTLDGNLNDGGVPAGSLNYRAGIITAYWDSTVNGTVIEDVTIRNTWYAGIVLRAAANENSAGNVISHATVQTVGGCTGDPARASAWGILLREAAGVVQHSSVTVSGCGIGAVGSGSSSIIADLHHNNVTHGDFSAYQLTSCDSGTAFHHNAASASPGNATVGILVQNVVCTLANNTVSGAKTGMLITGQDHSLSDLVVGTGNTFTGPGAGISGSVGVLSHDSAAPGITNSFSVVDAVVSDYETGLLVFMTSGGPASCSVEHSLLTANGTGVQIGSNASVTLTDNYFGGNIGLSVSNTSGMLADASGNWWGNADPAMVAAAVSDEVDYTPWLGSGLDTGDPGFYGDFSDLWVDDDSPQWGLTNRVQEAVDRVTGSTIHVVEGTYPGSVLIAGSWPSGLRLLGPNSGMDPCTDTRSGEAVVTSADANGTWRIESDHVTLDGLAFVNNLRAIHVTAAADCVVVLNCIVNGAVIDGINLWRAITARVENNLVHNVGLSGITAGDDAGTPDPSDDIVTSAAISDNCLDSVRLGITGYLQGSFIARNTIRDYAQDSLSAGISGQLARTIVRGNQVSGYSISAGLSLSGYANRPYPDSVLIDSNVFVMNAAGIYLTDPATNLSVIGNRFSNTSVNALDVNVGFYDANCWSDFRLNGGYPAQYHVPGAGGNVDANPNVGNCANLGLEMSSPYIPCTPDSLAKDTLYLTFDQTGFVTGQVFLQLPPELDCGWAAGTQYQSVLPGTNAPNLLFAAARRITGTPPHQVEVNVSWQPSYSSGDFTRHIACIPLQFVSGSAGQLLTISAYNPTFYDYSGPHTTDISVGSAQVRVFCVEPPQQLTIHHLPIGSVTLRWLPVTQDALGNPLSGPPDYLIYREQVVPGHFPPVHVATVQDTTYSELLQPGTVYLFEVRTQMPASP